MILACVVFIELLSMTDRRTDACVIAETRHLHNKLGLCFANALLKLMLVVRFAGTLTPALQSQLTRDFHLTYRTQHNATNETIVPVSAIVG